MTVEDMISGESEYIEFKQEVPQKSEVYMKTVVAFANGSGGKIVFGVEDGTFQVLGVKQEDAFSIMDGITSAICDSCTPMIMPIVTLASVEEKVVIVVNIAPGSQRPYYLTAKGKENGTYIRVSGTTRPADSFVRKELEFEGVNRCFDQTYAAPEASVTEDEINGLCNKMYQYAVEHCGSEEMAGRIRRLTRQNLLSWGFLVKRGDDFYPTNAFMLMTRNLLPQATIQCAVFKGKDRGIFIDRIEYGGDIVTQLDEAYKFVLRNIHMSSEINGLYRTDIYELPTDCIREMICNAVVHRSYLHPSSIQVAVYDDRVEVTSPGMLFGSLRLKDIREGISIPRNRALVYAFTYMNIMEHWGSGIPRIIRRCQEFGLEEPGLMEIAGSFRINLFRFLDQTRIGKSMDKSMPHTDKIRKSTDKKTANTDKLNGSYQKIIQYIQEKGTITNKEVQNLLNVKDSRALKILKELVEKGILKREGRWKRSYYELK
ncbi:MAG: winged helix-turn-helix transcriptional regulator [Lachnospiraceae bacterium]|nr:winged helix-turn-helix transcriptional regulator [Lachnospiraceae bacterium]